MKNISMYKIFLLVVILLSVFVQPLASLDFIPYSATILGELNRNSYTSVAMSVGIETLYTLSPVLKAGIITKVGTDFSEFKTVEFLLEGGCFFPQKKIADKIQFLCCSSIGFEQIWYDSTEKTTGSFGIDLRSVIDLQKIKNNTFTVMPYVRLGYPYLCAAGVSVGVVF